MTSPVLASNLSAGSCGNDDVNLGSITNIESIVRDVASDVTGGNAAGEGTEVDGSIGSRATEGIAVDPHSPAQITNVAEMSSAVLDESHSADKGSKAQQTQQADTVEESQAAHEAGNKGRM